MIRTLAVLWREIFRHNRLFLLVLPLSAAAFAAPTLAALAQKHCFDAADGLYRQMIPLGAALQALLVFYAVRCLSGGFIIPLGELKNILYSGSVEKSAAQSQHTLNNSLPLESYESAELFRLLQRARSALATPGCALERSAAGIAAVLALLFSAVAMAGILAALNPLYAILAVLSALPSLFGQLRLSGQSAATAKLRDEIFRQQHICRAHILDDEYLLETRIANAHDYFTAQWNGLQDQNDTLLSRLQTSRFVYGLGGSLFRSACVITIIATAAWQLAAGTSGVGTFGIVIALTGALSANAGYFSEIIGGNAGNVLELSDAVRYYALRGVAPATETKIISPGAIELRNVSFTYPAQDKPALQNINLNIGDGEKIAIIGANGSGKTTLAHLIAGIYTPCQGTISYGGTDGSAIHKNGLWQKMSAVFQNSAAYCMSIAENVQLGDVSIDDSKKITGALQRAGFNYKKYPDKESGFVGKDFGGIGLSGGEKRQLALARCYYRENARLVILDEPSDALDARSEERLYNRFLELSAQKTAIIISHRLGSCKIADRIIVMSDGTIAEEGTHEQLLARNGIYSRMYRAQSGLYRD